MFKPRSEDSNVHLTELEESLVFFTGLNNSACSQLTKAAAEVGDDTLGHQLLSKVREHLKLYEDEEKQFDVDHFFECIQSLENIFDYMTKIGSGAEKGREQLKHLKDYFEERRYEVGVYLLRAKQEHMEDKIRQNYWKN